MKKQLSRLLIVGSAPAFTLMLGCSSMPQAPSTTTRAPASQTHLLYPLNTKFEMQLANEDRLIDQIRDGMLAIQAESSKTTHDQLRRGTHAKGICAHAEMEIFDVDQWNPSVATRIKKGIFSAPGRYPTQVRFANAAGSVQPDSTNDVHAISISMQMPLALSNSQGLMDFSFNDAPFFPIGTAQVFADLMSFAKDQSVKSLYGRVGVNRGNAVMWAVSLGKLQELRCGHTTPYQKMRFWSDVPFALGDTEAVKYSLKPCEENQAEPLASGAKDALALELKRSLQNDNPPSCFDVQVQLLEPQKMTDHMGARHPASYWVENADAEWDESEAPFYTVGRLTLAHGAAIAPDACESWRINVTENNNVTHHGLGSINRARGAAEAASASNRLGH